MIPCLESGKGSCQDTTIIVHVFAVTVNSLGAFDGTERFQMQQRQEIRMKIAHGMKQKKSDFSFFPIKEITLIKEVTFYNK